MSCAPGRFALERPSVLWRLGSERPQEPSGSRGLATLKLSRLQGTLIETDLASGGAVLRPWRKLGQRGSM
jgi:hypothetical protein